MSFRAALPLLVSLVAGPVAAAEPSLGSVEGALSRSLLERGAFNACATLSPDSGVVSAYLAQGWSADLKDSAELLRAAGYPAAFVAAIPDRFTIENGTPQFASPAALQAFCAMLGDWQTRHSLFLISFPQFEIKEIIAKEQEKP